MLIKFYKHFFNNLLTFRTLNLVNIYEKLKLINKSSHLSYKLYICSKMLIKVLFYNINFKMLN